MAYVVTPLMGVALDRTYASLSGSEAGSAAPQLGTMVQANDGSQWLLCQASTTIAQYYAVGVDEDFKANPLTGAFASAGYTVGWAQVAVDPTAPYFWAALQGRANLNIAVASSCAADVALYTTTTAGVLDDSATATQALIAGVVIVTTQASTTGLAGTEAIITYARGR